MKTKITLIIAFFTLTMGFSQEKWSLEKCVNYALEHNLSVLRADQTTELRKQDIATAKGNVLPNISANAGQNFSFGSSIDPISNFRESTNRRSTNMGLNSSMILFDGFSNKYNILQSETSYQASLLDLQKMKEDISLNIVNSYLNVLFNKESLKLAQDQVEITKKQLERTQYLVDEGVQPRGNLMEIEATLATNESSVVTAENSVELSLLGLSQILQIPNKDFDVEDVVLNINSVALMYNDTEEIFVKAVEDRPEIKSAKLAVDNADTSIKIAKSAYLPSLSLNAGVNTGYAHRYGRPDDFFVPVDPSDPTGQQRLVKNGFFDQLDNNLGQSVGLSLSIPIFSQGRVKANVNRAKINREISEINLENTKLALREQIEQAYINARATLKEYEAAEKSVKAQEQSFQYSQERYNLGSSNSFEFEQVRTRLAAAQSDLARAKYNFVFRTKLLEFYYGIPIELE